MIFAYGRQYSDLILLTWHMASLSVSCPAGVFILLGDCQQVLGYRKSLALSLSLSFGQWLYLGPCDLRSLFLLFDIFENKFSCTWTNGQDVGVHGCYPSFFTVHCKQYLKAVLVKPYLWHQVTLQILDKTTGYYHVNKLYFSVVMYKKHGKEQQF